MPRQDYLDWSKEDLVAEILSLKRRQKFGLVWEDQAEEEASRLAEGIPLPTLIAENTLDSDENQKVNLLLEGDNLHSLSMLQFTHQNSVDLIYIDPPYNTGGNDFRYNDRWVDEHDSYRHSKWLSFMHKRLLLAHSLLKNEGAIFISIDNNEMAHLKLLCDQVFQEKNFIGVLIWRKKEGGGQTDQYFVTEHEYILCYAKSQDYKWQDQQEDHLPASFNFSDEMGNYKRIKLAKWGNTSRRSDRPTMYFPLTAPDGSEIFPIAPDGTDGRWRVGRERMKDLAENDLIDWKRSDDTWVPYEKKYFSPGLKKVIKERSILYKLASTGDGTKELTSIFGEKDVFENPKPTKLIEFLVKHGTHRDAVVLDFFAGSGTTGQAVLQLNKEDSGARQFILCTNDEEGIASKVCLPRLTTVIQGRPGKGEDVASGLKANLRHMKVSLSEFDGTDSSKRELTTHAVSLLCLKEGIFDEVRIEPSFSVFCRGSRKLLVLFDEDSIPEVHQILEADPDSIFLIYVFSLANDDLRENWLAYGDRVKSKPVPQAILNAYFRTLKTLEIK